MHNPSSSAPTVLLSGKTAKHNNKNDISDIILWMNVLQAPESRRKYMNQTVNLEGFFWKCHTNTLNTGQKITGT
jgi:hypothetical protein